MDELDCARCGTQFTRESTHAELVRRDFVEYPQSPKFEYLCRGCRQEYLTEFLGTPIEELDP